MLTLRTLACQAADEFRHEGALNRAHDAPARSDSYIPTDGQQQQQRFLPQSQPQLQPQLQPADEIEPGQEPDEHELQVAQENQSIHLHALDMLRKNSFGCTILGGQQTGKRTIVICFVKLLNEFKLAAEEYKKEKMLAKLVECSDRLQEITSRREEQEQQRQQLTEQGEHLQQHQRRTSRLNSWLPGGERVKSLLNLSPGGKSRLNSVVNLWGHQQHSPAGKSPAASSGEQHQMIVLTPVGADKLSAGDETAAAAAAAAGLNSKGSSPMVVSQQRRHTTIEPPAFQFPGEESPLRLAASSRMSNSSRYLDVGAPGNLLAFGGNKSDSNINYRTSTRAESPGLSPGLSSGLSPSLSPGLSPGHGANQLQVPPVDSRALQGQPDTVGWGRRSGPLQAASRRQSSLSPGSVPLPTTAGDQQGPPAGASINSQRRHTTLSTMGPGAGREPAACQQAAHERQRSHSRQLPGGRPPNSEPDNNWERRRRRRSTAARRQSICLSNRSKRILLSLKELNRRKFAIKFSTRRQLSATFLDQLRAARKSAGDQRTRTSRRRSLLLQLVQATAAPDSFLVVYSISDR